MKKLWLPIICALMMHTACYSSDSDYEIINTNYYNSDNDSSSDESYDYSIDTKYNGYSYKNKNGAPHKTVVYKVLSKIEGLSTREACNQLTNADFTILNNSYAYSFKSDDIKRDYKKEYTNRSLEGIIQNVRKRYPAHENMFLNKKLQDTSSK